MGGRQHPGGGDGNDALSAGPGADRLSGGTGADTLNGGLGNDTYVFNAGDGFDTVTDGGADSIVLGAGIAPSSVYFSRDATTLNVLFRNSNDRIDVARRFNGGAADGVNYVETLRFSDGTVIDLCSPTLPMEVTGGKGAVNGTRPPGGIDETIWGYNGNDIIQGNGGADDIYGYAGDDRLYGGSNFDYIYGGDGNDLLDGGDWTDRLMGGTGDDTIFGGGDGYQDHIEGDEGNDTLDGDAGNDNYFFRPGDGADTIVNNDSASTTDQLVFDAGIRNDQLWFERVASDLRVTVIGTSDQVTVQNWYGGNASQLDAIVMNDGKVLMAAQVEQLRSAMASFTASAAGQLELSVQQHQSLDAALAAAWK